MSHAADAARAFFFDLLRRELVARGDAQAPDELDDRLRLVPLREEALTPGDDGAEAPVRLRCGVDQRLGEMSVELDGESGELFSWFLDFLAADGDRSMPEGEALALATREAAPPEGARLESAGYEAQGGYTHYRARWAHVHEGLRVEGDFLELRINGANRSVFSFTRRWRTPLFR
jgi:hypothetical protein